MTNENEIERIEVIGPSGEKHVREARAIYSLWGSGLPNPPTPWRRIDLKGRKICCASTRGDGWHRGTCEKVGALHTDGRYYCGTHNPGKVKARRDERSRQWNLKWDYECKQRDLATKREAFRRAAAEAVIKIAAGHNDAMGLAREVAAMNPDR